MPVGAQDYIDQLLVRKYAQEQVDNHDAIESMVSPAKMMDAMTDYSNMSKNMFTLNQKLASICYKVKAQNAIYRKAAALES